MGDLNKKRILMLGSWLEKFLNPNMVGIDNYSELSESALKLLDINSPFSGIDVTSFIIQYMMNTEGWKDVRKHVEKNTEFQSWKYFEEYIKEKFMQNDWIYDAHGGVLKLFELNLSDPKDFNKFEIIINDTFFLIQLKFYTIPLILEKLIDQTLSSTEVIDSFKNKPECKHSLNRLIDNYKDKSKTIGFNDGKLRHGDIYSFPWLSALSYIFFEFLSYGDQPCYIFCDCCKQFSIVERSNRKKYCSVKCKNHNNYLKKRRNKLPI